MTAPGFFVTCPAYAAGPFKTHESAARALARIEALGACRDTPTRSHKSRRPNL